MNISILASKLSIHQLLAVEKGDILFAKSLPEGEKVLELTEGDLSERFLFMKNRRTGHIGFVLREFVGKVGTLEEHP